jgi:molybdopterin synthase catalytic subunit
VVGLVRKPINAEQLKSVLVKPEDGAVVVFEGVVRNHARGKKVRFLEYHAYEEMAHKKLLELETRIKRDFAIRDIGILHRLGRLDQKECSVAIVVTAAHREPAFDACRFAIDRLKETIPIWKKEFYESGEIWIEGN